MAGKQANTAEELTAAIRSLVDKALESDLRDQIVARGRDVASTLGTAGEAAAERASEAWRESEPMRREAAEAALRAGRDTVSWGRRSWTARLRPALRDGWTRRMAALAAAGVAVPTSRQVMDQARARLGIQRREERRWRSFFLGLVIGAVAGAIAALLTAPRAGREMRDELATRAREAATTAREAATTAREAASTATDWVPLFQRPQDEGLGAVPAEKPANQPVNGSGSDPLDDEALPVEGVADEPAPAETVPSAEDEVE
jgi:hypothetical protein